MGMRVSLGLVLLLCLFGLGCNNFEREVDLDIPPHERKLVVECFLEPGKPYRLVLTESVGFFDGPDTPFVQNAFVVISHAGIQDTLVNTFAIDFVDQKLFNYSSTAIVPADYTSEFSLYVRDEQGREVKGKTRIMPPIQFTDFSYSYDADSMAAIAIKWPDTPGQRNYYRFTLHLDSLVTVGDDGPSGLEFAFSVDDRIGDGEDFTLSTLFEYEKGQRAIATVYPMTESYWRYIETLSASAGANGNPFANPVTIYSTVEGGYGVFTGLTYDRDSLLIE